MAAAIKIKQALARKDDGEDDEADHGTVSPWNARDFTPYAKDAAAPPSSGTDHCGADARPCKICGYGDDAGTIIHCDQCNTPFHDGCAGAPPVAGDWLCISCK